MKSRNTGEKHCRGCRPSRFTSAQWEAKRRIADDSSGGSSSSPISLGNRDMKLGREEREEYTTRQLEERGLGGLQHERCAVASEPSVSRGT